MANANFPKNFFDVLKPDQNEKSYYFPKIGIVKTHVQLFENCQNLLALQVSCFTFRINFEWLANGTNLGQNNLNSFWGNICKNS